MEKKVKKEDLFYETDKHVCNFQQYKTIRFFIQKNIFAGKTALDKGLYITYVGWGPEGFYGGHEILQAYIERP